MNDLGSQYLMSFPNFLSGILDTFSEIDTWISL